MASKSGYINNDENEEVFIEEPKLSNSVSIAEQEDVSILCVMKILPPSIHPTLHI